MHTCCHLAKPELYNKAILQEAAKATGSAQACLLPGAARARGAPAELKLESSGDGLPQHADAWTRRGCAGEATGQPRVSRHAKGGGGEPARAHPAQAGTRSCGRCTRRARLRTRAADSRRCRTLASAARCAPRRRCALRAPLCAAAKGLAPAPPLSAARRERAPTSTQRARRA